MLTTKIHQTTSPSSTIIHTPQPPSIHTRQLFLPTIGTPILTTTLRPPDPSVTTPAQPLPTTSITDTLSSILGKKHNIHQSEQRPHEKKVKWTEEWSYHTYLPESATPPSSLLPTNPGSPNPTTPTIPTTSAASKSSNIHQSASFDPPSASNSALDNIHTQVHWPHNLISIVKNILDTKLPPPSSAPDFEFLLTREAALKNFCVLQRHHGDLDEAIQHQHTSPVGCGSEFRPVNILEGIIHPADQGSGKGQTIY